MKVVIKANKCNEGLVSKAIKDSKFDIQEVVVSGEGTVSTWAKENDIDVMVFKSNPSIYGKNANKIRDEKMLNYADGVVAVWNGYCLETKNIINKAKNKKKKVHIQTIESEK